ncbi:MAG TPA: Tex-like N-terminal domain-containing protein, partial [Bacteroidales bacterium]|nr:Tex-like N-terminal domain-containing protein [Bacteroidales bacterium]
MDKHVHIFAMELNLVPWQIENTLKLLAAGATIPFISRYRKEATGSLDEVQITEIRDLHIRFQELEKRRETIINSIREQGKLTDELGEKLNNALSLS